MLKGGGGGEVGTPTLGRAQRVAGEAPPPPPTITRELQSLMQGLRLDDSGEVQQQVGRSRRIDLFAHQRSSPADMRPPCAAVSPSPSPLPFPMQMGTISTLSPVRTKGTLRAALGGLARVITPVRRSARSKTPAKPLTAMLEEVHYSYGAPPAAQPSHPHAPHARHASRPLPSPPEGSRHSSGLALGSTPAPPDPCAPPITTPLPPLLPCTVPNAAMMQPLSGAAAAAAGAEEEEDVLEQAPVSGRPEVAASPGEEEHTPTGPTQRYSTRSASKQPPAPQLQHAPPPSPVVAQDASPQLADSPAAADAETPLADPPRYSLRASLRRSFGGGGAAGTPPPRASSVKLSPTEQGIRSALRRSARKNSAGK